MATPVVRPPAVSGMFYNSSPALLSQELDTLMHDGEPEGMPGALRALIAPHAGYMYSGIPAGRAYALLKGKAYDAVVVVGPSHRDYFQGISLYSGDSYRTPLGEIPLHKEIRELLHDPGKGIILSDKGHRDEHSIEVQLPFIQKALGSFLLVPIVMGSQNRQFCDILAEKLAGIANRFNVLLIASSDLSHYQTYDVAVEMDSRIVRRIEAFDAEGLLEILENEEAEACGGGPMVVVMSAAKKSGTNHSRILLYCNSGDVTGEKSRVVGYVSAAMSRVN